MKKKNQNNLYVSMAMLTAFVLWTMAVCIIDVRAIGPHGSEVGFATINALIHKLMGVHMALYHLTDWLGLVPIVVAWGFAMLGLRQWIKRKQLRKVDYDLFVLGGFYMVVMTAYLFFEMVTVNYRPVLIEGILETSYPSSTTLLVLCVMPTALMQCKQRMENAMGKRWVSGLIVAFTIFMVAGRLISGVHWFTDIVGGGLLSAGLVMMYRYFIEHNR